MNKDKYGEIINGKETFEKIANLLKQGESAIIGWTDELFTHYDILFTMGAYKEDGNYFQRGIKANDLFVSVMSKGAFGFKVENGEKHPSYIAEKLYIVGDETVEKFGELINGVIKELV